MKLFKKEKGIILSILNAILVLWAIGAIVVTFSNASRLILKDYTYNYDEYKIAYCDFEYSEEQECKDNYTLYKLDEKNTQVEIKRNIFISSLTFIIVISVLAILNKEAKEEKEKKEK